MQIQEPYVQLKFEDGHALFISMVDGAIGGLDEALAALGRSTLLDSIETLVKIGEGLESDKNYAAASNVYAGIARILEQLGSPLNAALMLSNQALAHKRDQRPNLALHVYGKAAALLSAPLPDPDEERERSAALAQVLSNLAILQYQRGAKLEAAQAATSAMQLARMRNDATSQTVIRECGEVLKKLNV